MPQPVWEFVVADANGVNLGILTLADERRITRQRNGVTVFEAAIPLTSAQATLLTPGASRIKGYRSPVGGGTKVLRFNGIVWVVEQIAQDNGVAMMKIVAVDPLGATLKARHSTANYGSVDQGTILKQLIDDANTVSDTFVRTNAANITTSIARTIDWTNTRKSIADGFGEIASALDGTDFELRPIDEGAKIADLYVYGGRRGTSRDEVVFGYGAGTVANCTAIQQTWNMDRLATFVHGDGQGGSYFEWANSTKIAKFGRYERFTSYGDVVNPTYLSGLVYQNLIDSYDPQPIIGFTAGIRAPRIYDEWDIGDAVRVQGRRGALNIDTTARILGATIQIDSLGVETVASIVTQSESTDVGGSTSASVA